MRHDARTWSGEGVEGLLDGIVHRIGIAQRDGRVDVELHCQPRRDCPITTTIIHLSGVTRMDMAWETGDCEFYLVADYKLLVAPDRRAYLSLDPFDAGSNEPDERDAFVFEAASLTVSLTRGARRD